MNTQSEILMTCSTIEFDNESYEPFFDMIAGELTSELCEKDIESAVGLKFYQFGRELCKVIYSV